MGSWRLARIDADEAQLKLVHGYDHNWVLNAARGKATLRLAANQPAFPSTILRPGETFPYPVPRRQ